MELLNEVKTAIDSRELSSSLRLSKFAELGKQGADAFHDIAHWKQKNRPLNLSLSEAKEVLMKLNDRLILNQSGGVLENAQLCVDRNFGCPYIPGSAIKGVARHRAWEDWYECENEENKKEIAKNIAFTFGFPTGDKALDDYLKQVFPEWFKDKKAPYQAIQGAVAFLPAYPYKKASFEVDVLTCHHMDYYAGNRNIATDDENPNPQFFPVVKAGATFRFILLPLRKQNMYLEFATTYLVKALEENGIGAKTNAGYGWFERDLATEGQLKKEKEEQVKKNKREELEKQKEALIKCIEEAKQSKEDYDNLSQRFNELKSEYDELGPGYGMHNAQGIEQDIRKLKPEETPLDKERSNWEGQNHNAILNGTIAKFQNLKEDRQELIVTLLREAEGIGYEIWKEIKSSKNKKVKAAEGNIRGFSKRKFGEKMP